MDEQDKIAGRRASEAAAKAAAKVVKNPEFRGTATAVKKSSASVKPKAKPAAVAAKKVTATRMTRPGSSVKSTPKSSAPSAISGKKVSTTASKKSFLKHFWHYHQLDKDMCSFYGGREEYPMSDDRRPYRPHHDFWDGSEL